MLAERQHSSSDDESVDLQKGSSIDQNAEDSTNIPSIAPQTSTQQASTLLQYRDFFHFLIGLTLPYIFHPLLGIEVYYPGLVTMWPFTISSTFTAATGIKSLAGKVVLVTGGNNGIGRETVLQLAKHNPQKIFLAARTESKARDAIAAIKSQISQDVDIEYLPLDLTSLPSIKSAADQVISHSDRLDVLVLNAGIMACPPGKTPSGQDIQMGTNHVGHFLLTKLLLPTLQRTAKQQDSDVRVISVSSEANNLAPNFDTIISTEKLTNTSPWTRYGASKAANIMFAAELARRYPSLTSVSLHPGMIKTDLYVPSTNSNMLVRYGAMLFGPLMFQTVANGALNQLWASVGVEKPDLVNGGYYTPVGKLRSNKWSSDAEAGRKLWEWTEKELKTAGY